MEVLAIAMISNRKKTKGITVKNEDRKMSQYACDSSLGLDGNLHALSCALELLDAFAPISGLKVNYAKH